MAASAASPPASWKAWRRSASRPCGYGIRYDHGLFRQVIKDGEQQEYPENWLSFGNPWEFERPEAIYDIGFGGFGRDDPRSPSGGARAVWHPGETVQAVAYDTPMVGWRGRHVNPLRLWSARAVDPLRLDVFNSRRPCRRADASRRAPRRSRRSSIRATRRRPGRSCGCGRNISSSPPRCRISCSGTCASTATSARCRTRPPIQLNDTHPASPSPS